MSTPSLLTRLHNGQVDAGLAAVEPVEDLIDGNLELGRNLGSHILVRSYTPIVLSFDMHPGK